ncbi:tRNA nucleotidyltransferase [Pseudoalteromonas 'SMAR']|uniref:tRNA nucleotidyltransferase n=1 Tax=Pseudoalteromonas 'SMAR' TaxID=3416908 RepID=UPI003AF2D36B
MKTYLVGGAVRDELLGRTVKEQDYVVVGSCIEEMERLGYQQVGKDFPVFLHPKSKEEHALARTERKSGQGYGGFICDFGPDITLEDDLIRRDLTVNAIAKDEDGTLIDPYGGIADIEDRILRHVSDAFSEDPLRVLRVARFAARYHSYGFTIAPETWQLMQTMVAEGELTTLTPERVWLEIEKTMADGALGHFLTTLTALKATADVAPYLSAWNSNSERDYQNATAQLDNDAQFAMVAQFSLAMHFAGSSTAQLTQAKQLKVPNLFLDSADDLLANVGLLSQPHLDATDWLALMQNLDAWRRPQKLTRFCFICEHINGLCQQRSATLQHYFSATKAVDVQAIIKQGFQGKAIQQQLQQQRLEAIISRQ